MLSKSSFFEPLVQTLMQSQSETYGFLGVGNISKNPTSNEHRSHEDFNPSTLDLTSAPWSRMMLSPFWKIPFSIFWIKISSKKAANGIFQYFPWSPYRAPRFFTEALWSPERARGKCQTMKTNFKKTARNHKRTSKNSEKTFNGQSGAYFQRFHNIPSIPEGPGI